MTKVARPRKFFRNTLISISRVTNVLLGVFILLFAIMSSFSYIQLKETEATYERISSEVLPTLASSGLLHSQISALAFLVSNFAQSSSLPEVRINESQVLEKLSEIERLLADNNPLHSDLETIKSEFAALTVSTRETFQHSRQESQLIEQVNQLRANSVIDTSMTEDNLQAIYSLEAAISQLSSAEKLIDLRRYERAIKSNFNMLLGSPQIPQNTNQYLTELQSLVVGNKGLSRVKALQLRGRARAAGQSNFLRRFILDIAKGAEFSSYQFAEQQSALASEFARDAARKHSYTLMVYAATFAIGLALILFIKSRVVSRIIGLNNYLNSSKTDNTGHYGEKSNDEIGALARTIAEQFEVIDKQKVELTKLSFVDSLTKVGNRRAFNEHIEQIIPISKRNKISVSVLLIDVDCFKQFNDTYGHMKGDECLYKVAQVIEQNARRGTDFVARYGGEEFVCTILGHTEAQAYEFAEKLCDDIRALAIPHSESVAADVVTVSIGLHTETDVNENSIERLIQRADTALYRAKTQGRNQVCKYSHSS
ncbi:GGDEF domain-containing protein [Alteromonas sp. ASW11-36]|uniref:diguanylate cyclase n=1 Tax=Alteromonas arenosi TaxID=3055817 RepID=A0ABT7SWT1_9ALTE|nr:GGDEF domain-containing protein [Alteromonas sp. ASW11-36]MDM7860464.1 GGDEF domain-containing protein [Alteromonas sp. ASW11-36]